MRLRPLFVVLLSSLIACEALKELGKPTEPDTGESRPAATGEDIAPDEPKAAEEPPAFEPPSPDAARQSLEELGIQYNQRSFIEAAGAGRLNVVQLFVWAGMDPNVQPYTASAVYVSLRDNPTRFSHLRSSWFPQGTQDNDTALMKASYGGYMDVVQFLVEHKANPGTKNNRNQQPIHFAAAGGHLAVVEYLVAVGGRGGLFDMIDPWTFDVIVNGPRTPLHWAAVVATWTWWSISTTTSSGTTGAEEWAMGSILLPLAAIQR